LLRNTSEKILMVDKMDKDTGWHRITQYIRSGLTPLPFGILLYSVSTLHRLKRQVESKIHSGGEKINDIGKR